MTFYRWRSLFLAVILLVVTAGPVLAASPAVTAQDWLEKGKTFAVNKDYTSALFAFSEALQIDPHYAEAYYQRGLLYQLVKQHLPLAVADLSKAIENDPGKIEAYFARGIAYGAMAKPAEAADDFSRLLEQDSTRTEVYYFRGIAFQEQKKYEEAAADYGQVIAQYPDKDLAYSQRGECYIELKNYDSAIADYSRAMEINPKNPEYYVNRGHVYGVRKEYEKAMTDALLAIALDANSVAGHFNLAQSMEMLGNRPGALDHYRIALKGLPEDAVQERQKAQARLAGKWDGYQEWM